MNRRVFLSSAAVGATTLWAGPLKLFSLLQDSRVALSREQMEEFLLTAEIVGSETTIGITRPQRATLTDGLFTHDAQIQAIDDYQLTFTGAPR